MNIDLYNKNNFKIKSFIIINSISSFLCLLWFNNKISTKNHLLLELFLLFTKTPVEYYCNNLSNDIIFHHTCMIIGSTLVMNKKFSYYADIISVMQIIHIPLTSYYCHKLLKLKKKKNKYFYNSYLLTWLPCSIYRNTNIIKIAYKSIYNRNINNSILLSLFSLGFIYLDYSWTPWNKYKQLIKNII